MTDVIWFARTFKLQVLHSALGQRAERVPRIICRWVEDVGLPLLQDVLQQLVQHVTCGEGAKGQRLLAVVSDC